MTLSITGTFLETKVLGSEAAVLSQNAHVHCDQRPRVACVLVLYWTGTWWSGVDDTEVKEGNRLIFRGLCSWLSHSRESAGNRQRERERERQIDIGTQTLMEQRCFNQHDVGIYTVLQGSYSQQR